MPKIRPNALLCAVLLASLCTAGAARAGIELWEGESITLDTAPHRMTSGGAMSSDSSVATVDGPKGDAGTITIKGVKEGSAVITVQGTYMHLKSGSGKPGELKGTDSPFQRTIAVTVVKAEKIVKMVRLKRNQRWAVSFDKKYWVESKGLTNSNPKVCFHRRNTQRKVTLTGKKAGHAWITLRLRVKPEGGKKYKKRAVGFIYCEVIDQRRKMKERHIYTGFDELGVPAIVILDDEKDERHSFLYEEDLRGRDGTEYVAFEGDGAKYCTLDPSRDPTVVVDSTPDEEGQYGPPPAALVAAIEQGEPIAYVGPLVEHEEEEPPPEEETRVPPDWVVAVKAQSTVVRDGRPQTTTRAGAMTKLNLGAPPALARGDDTGYDADPISGLTDADGVFQATVSGEDVAAYGLEEAAAASDGQVEVMDVTDQGGALVRMRSDPRTSLPAPLKPYLRTVVPINGTPMAVLSYPKHLQSQVDQWLKDSPDVVYSEEDLCRIKESAPDDPYYASEGAWGQAYDDQWALKRVGLDDGAWASVAQGHPVVVAVIDTGIDWNHRDLSWDNLWINEDEVPDNGLDDDGNGFVDDRIGWNFVGNDNKPWDRDGHGTFVAGVIAAETDNAVGIAGINPNARIMVLKSLNSFGHTRASFLTQAILYAADNGAQVINMSVGGDGRTRTEQEAIDYAHSKGVVVVVAAGNQGADMSDYGLAAMNHVITVAATDTEDRRVGFSNWGRGVDLAAPGVDVLSLRAARTDLMRDIPGVDYQPGRAYVGADKRYYRAAGTSFAAPFAAGAASLLLSRDPTLTPDQVKRLLMQSARDIEVTGVDQYTGYGRLDVKAALAADPAFFVEAEIAGLEVVETHGAQLVQVKGTADADRLKSASVEIGAGEEPDLWKRVGELDQPVRDGVLATIPASELRGTPVWMIRVTVEHADGRSREMRFQLNLE